jgi:uncharacterized membrane protein YgdD (TMEM256/DUF423 family)
MKLFLVLGSVNMAIAIALGAFGAHGLSGKVTEKMLHNWNTAAQYHMIHALGLLSLGILLMLTNAPFGYLQIAGWIIFLGILFFSGSLYALVLTDIRTWGMIPPIGGTFFILSWILTAIGCVKQL